MRNRKYKAEIKIITCLTITCAILLSGCGNSGNSGAGDALGADRKKETSEKNPEQEDYSDYIRSAVDVVSKDIVTPVPEEDDGLGQIVTVPRMDEESIYVSSSEQLPEDSGITPVFGDDANAIDDGKKAPESSEQNEESEDSDEGEVAELTPDVFDVGKCCIYINGEIDEAYGSDIIKAINKARVDLGYAALNEKTGLDTCADRRTREIASYLSHMRPNASPFYSLAPMYFKAEMLAIDGAKPEETVDAWIRDPVSRSLIFGTKYMSVGAACFKCNGLNCVVVAFGY